MKTISINQSYFFPYIGYWQLIAQSDVHVIYDDVAFIKGGWIHRNYILPNGKGTEKQRIGMVLHKPSSFKMINEINITGGLEEMQNQIHFTYKKAVSFQYAWPTIQAILECKERNLVLFLQNSIIHIAEYLGINTEFILSSTLEKDNELHAQAKVIHINQLLNADRYINAWGGRGLYSKSDFTQAGIQLQFVLPEFNAYPQFYRQKFMAGLSIIDLMMFNTKQDLRKMVQGGALC